MRIDLDPALLGDRHELSSDEFRALVDGTTMPAERTTIVQDERSAPKGRQTRERDFRDRVVALARSAGWLTYFTQRSDRSPAGFPDLILVRGDCCLAVELKVPPNKPTKDQWRWLGALGAAGLETAVWYPDAWELIEDVLR